MKIKHLLLALCALLSLTCLAAAQNRTENVVLITLDGARTQEIFGGVDLEIVRDKTRRGKVEDSPLYKKYWADTPQQRREKLMPFFWGTLMKQHGSIAGNRSLGSAVMSVWAGLPDEIKQKILAEAAIVWDREYNISQLPQKLEIFIKRHPQRLA